jgi:hypothetical protein
VRISKAKDLSDVFEWVERWEKNIWKLGSGYVRVSCNPDLMPEWSCEPKRGRARTSARRWMRTDVRSTPTIRCFAHATQRSERMGSLFDRIRENWSGPRSRVEVGETVFTMTSVDAPSRVVV